MTLENQKISLENDLDLIKKGASSDLKKQYLAQIEQVQENLRLLKTNRGNYSIKAPISGVITEKYIKEGSYLTPGMQLLEIGNENDLYVEADVLVSEIKDIAVGDKVRVYNEDLEISIADCILSKIYPKAHTKISDLGIEQKRVKIEIEFEGETDILKQGYDVDVEITTDIKENALVVNEDDIYEEDKVEYVDVLVDSKAEKRQIKTGITQDEEVEILEGLKLGDKIVKIKE